MQRFSKIAFVALLLMVSLFSLAAQGGGETAAPTVSGPDSDGDGIPDSAEQLLGTNPHAADTDGDSIDDAADKSPLTSSVTLTETSSTPLPLTVTDARTEDNFRADDHLEISLENTSGDPVVLSDCYFTITDMKSNAQESYYVDLGGFTIDPGSQATLHFDNKTGAGHFPGNTNGLYRTGADGLSFDVLLHSKGFAPLPVHTEKSPGTAEVAD